MERTIVVVCYGSYQTNIGDNRGEGAKGIHRTDTYRCTWGSLTTTYQVSNACIL